MSSNTEMKDPGSGDVRVVPNELVGLYRSRGWESTTPDDAPADDPADDPAELKGQALDAALKDAGLSTSGTVEEKRLRLTEHADDE